MPTIRKVDATEAEGWEKNGNKNTGARKIVAAEYDAYFADVVSGDFLNFDLSDDEKRLTVKNRIHAAATRKGLGVRFIRTKGNSVRVEVVSKEIGAAADGESAAE